MAISIFKDEAEIFRDLATNEDPSKQNLRNWLFFMGQNDGNPLGLEVFQWAKHGIIWHQFLESVSLYAWWGHASDQLRDQWVQCRCELLLSLDN